MCLPCTLNLNIHMKLVNDRCLITDKFFIHSEKSPKLPKNGSVGYYFYEQGGLIQYQIITRTIIHNKESMWMKSK